MPPLEESLLESEPSPAMEEVEDMTSRSQEISLEDIESTRAPQTIHPGAEIDMSSVEGLGDAQEADMAHSGAIEDVSSEFLDLAEEPSAQHTKAQESDFGAGLDDVTSEFLDMEGPAAPRPSEPAVDFEPLDIDLQFDDTPVASRGSPSVSSEAGFEAVTEFDDFLSVEEGPAPGPAVVARAGFDDVSAVERELSAPTPEPTRIAQPSTKPDLSTEILLKIAEELSSIRSELVSLKTQIGDVVKSAVEPGQPRISEHEEANESEPSGGFFDEEEDETIALTGDELDNILNTADFTEEIAEAEQPLDLESEIMPPNLLDETLLPESGDYSSPAAAPAIEEVRIGQDDSVDEVGHEPLEPDQSELSLVVEEGIKPMTSAPEDTSYLETPDFEAGPMDFEGAPLADEPLVEPDLSDFDLETEELEPRLEIDEELPLVSTDSSAEELTLGIDAGPGYAAEEPAVDAEFLEPVNEIEEPNFAEISLHEEGLDSAASSEPSDLEEIDVLSDSGLSASLSPEYPSQNGAPSGGLPAEEEEDLVLEAEEPIAPVMEASRPSNDGDRLKAEIKSVLSYLDKLLDSLPEDKIEEFANSEYFDTYKKLFEELGLV